jgi:hypothetical protein
MTLAACRPGEDRLAGWRPWLALLALRGTPRLRR